MRGLDPVTRAAILACKGQASRGVIAERYGVSVNAVRNIWYSGPERGKCKPPPSIYTEELCEAVRELRDAGRPYVEIGAMFGLSSGQVEWALSKRGTNSAPCCALTGGEWTEKQYQAMDNNFRKAMFAAYPALEAAPMHAFSEQANALPSVDETVAAQAQPVAMPPQSLSRRPVYFIADVVKAASRRYGFTPQQLTGKQREKELVRARHIAMFAAIKITGRELKRIGKVFDADHTTVVHARDKIKKLIQTDVMLAQEIDSFIKELAA